ncbi:hypothetical protein KCP69_02575 [Salmonella enterica subsp. enterica]|nr:hypothetical protein KCP69_02575 [Salmonella enterica subsp. enterica]
MYEFHPRCMPPLIRFHSFHMSGRARRKHPDADRIKRKVRLVSGSEQRRPTFSRSNGNALANACAWFAERFCRISRSHKSAWLPPQHCVRRQCR